METISSMSASQMIPNAENRNISAIKILKRWKLLVELSHVNLQKNGKQSVLINIDETITVRFLH